MTRNAQILGTGSYVPELVVTNAEVDALMGESTNEWLLANVGIRERRWMSPEQTTSDLVVEASKKAIERAGISASNLDLIIARYRKACFRTERRIETDTTHEQHTIQAASDRRL